MMNRRANSIAIPIDLIHQILSRLPAKSISRFCCVSKLWRSIICSQYFNELFHATSSSNPRLLIGIEDEGGWSFFSSPHPRNHYGKSSIEVSADFHFRVYKDSIPETHRFYYWDSSYASGLIFLSKQVNVICNPSTKQYVILPPNRIPEDEFSYGLLGFDPIGKQFKVLVYKVRLDDELIYHILTLGNENERWREIKCPLNYDVVWDHTCINGILYYVAAHGEGYDYDFDLICFDVRFEKFKFLQRDCFNKVINYKGKLGVVNLIIPLRGFPFELRIWVLEDIEKVEWTKYAYTLKVPENIFSGPAYKISIVGATASGDIVLGKTCKPFCVLYFNPERKTYLCVNIEGIKAELGNPEAHYFVDYAENLGFDVMKTNYAETCMCKRDRTKATQTFLQTITISSNDINIIKQ